jgi:mono/diheme cytochrome c family protein
MLRIAAGLVLALFVIPAVAFGQTEPVGRPDTGKALMRSGDQRCDRCHGVDGEGAYGPDLAGTTLTFAQFARAVRQPFGIMPSFTEGQMSDQRLADIRAYFASLPRVATPGPRRQLVPEGASAAQRTYIDFATCGQCHGPEAVGQPRHLAGGAGADWEWFKKTVYEHSSTWPRGHMPNFSRDRLPESVLREVWQYLSVDLGLLADVRASVNAPASSNGNATYTVTVQNFGLKGKGMTAEGLSISVAVPAEATVVSATGTGYQGVRPDPKTGAPTARWSLARLVAAEAQTFTITLSGPAAAAGIAKGSLVSWAKPALREGFPKTVTTEDSVNITAARAAESQ